MIITKFTFELLTKEELIDHPVSGSIGYNIEYFISNDMHGNLGKHGDGSRVSLIFTSLPLLMMPLCGSIVYDVVRVLGNTGTDLVFP